MITCSNNLFSNFSACMQFFNSEQMVVFTIAKCENILTSRAATFPSLYVGFTSIRPPHHLCIPSPVLAGCCGEQTLDHQQLSRRSRRPRRSHRRPSSRRRHQQRPRRSSDPSLCVLFAESGMVEFCAFSKRAFVTRSSFFEPLRRETRRNDVTPFLLCKSLRNLASSNSSIAISTGSEDVRGDDPSPRSDEIKPPVCALFALSCDAESVIVANLFQNSWRA